jgi:hypothetical protein
MRGDRRLPRTQRIASVCLLCALSLLAGPARAEENAQGWSMNLSGALYVLPHEDNYFQPTFRADRGRTHLEARYNYEDHQTGSLFAGANYGIAGSASIFAIPMIGVVAGQTDGLAPGLELGLTWWRIDLYGEAEYLLGFGADEPDYFYMWSETSIWATNRLRIGGVTQRTRAHGTDDTQPGFLVGARFRNLEGTAYAFNPGADDDYTVLSVSIKF